MSGFEARNTQNALHPNRPIAIPEFHIQEINTLTLNYWRPSRELLKIKHYLDSVRYLLSLHALLSLFQIINPR